MILGQQSNNQNNLQTNSHSPQQPSSSLLSIPPMVDSISGLQNTTGSTNSNDLTQSGSEISDQQSTQNITQNITQNMTQNMTQNNAQNEEIFSHNNFPQQFSFSPPFQQQGNHFIGTQPQTEKIEDNLAENTTNLIVTFPCQKNVLKKQLLVAISGHSPHILEEFLGQLVPFLGQEYTSESQSGGNNVNNQQTQIRIDGDSKEVEPDGQINDRNNNTENIQNIQNSSQNPQTPQIENILDFSTLLNDSYLIPYEFSKDFPSTIVSTTSHEYLTTYLDDTSTNDQYPDYTGAFTPSNPPLPPSEPLSLSPLGFLLMSYLPQLPSQLPLDQHLRLVIPHIVDSAVMMAVVLTRFGARLNIPTHLVQCRLLQHAIVSTINTSSLFIQQQSLYEPVIGGLGISAGGVPPLGTIPAPFQPFSTPFSTTPPSNSPQSTTNGIAQQNNGLNKHEKKLFQFCGGRLRPVLAHCVWMLHMTTEIFQISLNAHYQGIFYSLQNRIALLSDERFQHDNQQWGDLSEDDEDGRGFRDLYQNFNLEHTNNYNIDFREKNNRFYGQNYASYHPYSQNSQNSQNSQFPPQNSQSSSSEPTKLAFTQGAKPFIPSVLQSNGYTGRTEVVNGYSTVKSTKVVFESSAFPSLGSTKKSKVKDDEVVNNKTTLLTSSGKQVAAKDEKSAEKGKAKEKKNEGKAAKKVGSQNGTKNTQDKLSSDSNRDEAEGTPSANTECEDSECNQEFSGKNTQNSSGQTNQQQNVPKKEKTKKQQTFSIDEFHLITSTPGETAPLSTSIKPIPYQSHQPYNSSSNFHPTQQHTHQETPSFRLSSANKLQTHAAPFVPQPPAPGQPGSSHIRPNGYMGQQFPVSHSHSHSRPYGYHGRPPHHNPQDYDSEDEEGYYGEYDGRYEHGDSRIGSGYSQSPVNYHQHGQYYGQHQHHAGYAPGGHLQGQARAFVPSQQHAAEENSTHHGHYGTNNQQQSQSRQGYSSGLFIPPPK
jgi:hypothetical protein